jgi:predicted DNA binding CopG/RHH family protein
MSKEKKTARVEMRMTARIKERVKEKAKDAGMTLSAYVEYLLNNAAA